MGHKEIYTGIQYHDYNSGISHNSGFFTGRRPYNLEEYFNYDARKNKSCKFKMLIGGAERETSVNATSLSSSDHYVENITHMLKTYNGSSPNWAKVYYSISANPYWQLIGCGGGFDNDTKIRTTFYHPNVVGMTFSWSRHKNIGTYWEAAYIGCKFFGMNFYNPKLDQWRTVRFTKNSTKTVNGHTTHVSPEDDTWEWRQQDLENTDAGNDDYVWNPCRAMLSPAAQQKIIDEEWYWGGVFFEVKGAPGKTSSRARVLGISDVQPIYGPYGTIYQNPDKSRTTPRIILPQPTVRSQESLKEGMFLMTELIREGD